VLALTLERGRATTPVHDGTELRVGDIVTFVAGSDAKTNVWARLEEAGWTRLDGQQKPQTAPAVTT
jgi:hypothetical protein